MSEQSDNLDAIDRYIKTTPIKTPAASKLRDAWIKYYDATGWYDRNWYSPLYDWARNRKHEFNLANAVTEADKAAAVLQAKKGLSTEELKGEPDRRLASGNYVDPPPPGKEPFFPTRVKVAAGIAAVAAVGLTVLKKLYIDPFLPKRR